MASCHQKNETIFHKRQRQRSPMDLSAAKNVVWAAQKKRPDFGVHSRQSIATPRSALTHLMARRIGNFDDFQEKEKPTSPRPRTRQRLLRSFVQAVEACFKFWATLCGI